MARSFLFVNTRLASRILLSGGHFSSHPLDLGARLPPQGVNVIGLGFLEMSVIKAAHSHVIAHVCGAEVEAILIANVDLSYYGRAAIL